MRPKYRLDPELYSRGVRPNQLEKWRASWKCVTSPDVAATSVLIDAGEALVVDPGPSLRHGQRVRASLACRFKARVRWVANTHAHAEQVLANSAFVAPVMALSGTAQAMRKRCPQCLASLQDDLGAQAMQGTRIVLPSQVFGGAERTVLNLLEGMARLPTQPRVTLYGHADMLRPHLAGREDVAVVDVSDWGMGTSLRGLRSTRHDARLLRQSYGRRMLKGLPPYRLQRRADGVLSDVGPVQSLRP